MLDFGEIMANPEKWSLKHPKTSDLMACLTLHSLPHFGSFKCSLQDLSWVELGQLQLTRPTNGSKRNLPCCPSTLWSFVGHFLSLERSVGLLMRDPFLRKPSHDFDGKSPATYVKMPLLLAPMLMSFKCNT